MLIHLILVFAGFVFVDFAGFVDFVGDVGSECAGGSGEGEVEAVGHGAGLGQDVRGTGGCVETGRVVAGKLEAIEEGGGAAGFRLA